MQTFSGRACPPFRKREVLLSLMAAVTLLAGSVCSWFPLVDYPPAPPAPAVEQPVKVIDLTFSGTES